MPAGGGLAGGPGGVCGLARQGCDTDHQDGEWWRRADGCGGGVYDRGSRAGRAAEPNAEHCDQRDQRNGVRWAAAVWRLHGDRDGGTGGLRHRPAELEGGDDQFAERLPRGWDDGSVYGFTSRHGDCHRYSDADWDARAVCHTDARRDADTDAAPAVHADGPAASDTTPPPTPRPPRRQRRPPRPEVRPAGHLLRAQRQRPLPPALVHRRRPRRSPATPTATPSPTAISAVTPPLAARSSRRRLRRCRIRIARWP